MIAAYITSYISKMDKTQNISWRDVLRQLDREMHETAVDVEVDDVDRALHRDIYDTVKRIVADREMTAQEAALDALQLPLIQFSTSIVYVQTNRPEDTYVLPRKRKDRAKRRMIDEEQHRHLVYDPPVNKYVLRMYKPQFVLLWSSIRADERHPDRRGLAFEGGGHRSHVHVRVLFGVQVRASP